MGVILKLKTIRDNLTKVERKIADYILENPKKIKDLNTYDIAKGCNTSQASIVRFSKRIGFEGFSEFKYSLNADLGNIEDKDKVNIINEEISTEDSSENILNKISTDNKKAIDETLEITDLDELDNAVNSIEKANKIMIVGAGFSSITAKDLYYKLLELGKSVVFDSDFHLQLTRLPTMRKNDILFVISYSGKTKDIYDITVEAKKRGIKIITLTNIDSNPIRDLGDIKLNTIKFSSNFRATPLSPRISQLTIIDTIYVKLILNNKKMQDYVYNSLKIVNNFKI